MIRKEIKKLKNSSSVEELVAKKEALLKEYFSYRLQKASNQLKQVHLLRRSRREIAFVNTMLRINKTAT